MKKHLIKISILSLILFCSCSKQPECSNEEAKKTAIELSQEILLTDLAFKEFVKKERFNLLLDIKTEKYFLNAKNDIQNEIKSKIQNVESDSTIYTKYVDRTIEFFNELSPELNNIRTSNKNEEIKKCFCQAELNFNNGDSIDIEYTVQTTEEGETYVEVEIENQ
jgi:hypothetical protein